MKKDQKQRMAFVGLLTLMAVVVGVQVFGANGPAPKPQPQKTASTLVAERTLALDHVDDPVIARDAFWNPRLAEEQPPVKTTTAEPNHVQPLPTPMAEPTDWIPPLRPSGVQPNMRVEPIDPPAKTEPKPEPPKEEPPKKSIRVCGFLATQTPTLILSMNGEEIKTCTTGQQPWPGVKVLEIQFDQAKLKLSSRTVTVKMGQEVEI